MEQFSENFGFSIPKKLSFDDRKKFDYSDIFDSSITKKRKLSLEKNDSISSINLNNSVEKNSSRESLNSSLGGPPSPWESRRMKADLLEAKSRITKLKTEIEQMHKVRTNMETLYNSQVTELKKQCEFSSDKVLDMEKHLKMFRKRENTIKQELVKVKNELNQQKQNSEDKIYNLQRANVELEENARHLQNRMTNDVNEYKRMSEKLQIELDLANEELENYRSQYDDMQEKGYAFDEIHSELMEERQEHEQAKSKIKQLEYDLGSYEEWKEISKTTQTRLSNIPDLEKELARLQKENKSLRENIGNKLLLEEQVYDLKTRLEKNENANSDTVTLKSQIQSLEHELDNWKNVGKDHCFPNTAVNPSTLRSRIEQILQKDLILTSEKGSSKSEKDTYQHQMQELKTQNDIYIKLNSELKIALKHREAIMLRAKKKLVMVGKERDCYKQLVENYEKDLTISGALIDAMNPDSQLRSRCEILEKNLNGYKELCSALEKEIESIKQYPDLPLSDMTSDNYDDLKKEIDTLRVENDRLRRRKEELELEMEHRCLKGDFNMEKVKVLHMKMNPAAEAYENTKNEMEKLQAEIERLKRKNRKLEENQEEMTQRLNETQNLTVNIKEMNTLRSKLESSESKMQHMKEVYKSASIEYREVVYMLFGYRVDRVGNAMYRISSMYAESEDEYLNFRLNESGILDMLETDYSASLNEMVNSHLAEHNSLPAFLSSLTLELLNRTTIMVIS